MRVRWIGLAVALALIGGAAGFGVGKLTQESAASQPGAAPVPAVSPSYPVNEYDVLPDPGIAPLAPDLALHQARFRAGGLRMTADVPVGWRRAPLTGRDSWNFVDPDNPLNTYLLRVGIDAGDRISVTVARESRIAALQDAESNDNIQHVVVEERTDDGFTATYIAGGYQRVTMERWLPQEDSTQAFATFAVTGREVDREGMADLLERVVASASY